MKAGPPGGRPLLRTSDDMDGATYKQRVRQSNSSPPVRWRGLPGVL